MDYTKQEVLGFNWVVRLDGQTVHDAISTLQGPATFAGLVNAFREYQDQKQEA